jgi:diaminohydroxyphosphoribosylaminopyrimidine deaminase / 5-amino-6-(5-phosphoribosylamino)uracil reductase
MQRCLQLAQQGAGHAAPNPMVGAVLVHEGRIIGEGYHEQYGEAHAEVNCINRVPEADRHLISQSALYVSLEPCAHYGKTPPCSRLILDHKIPVVVVGATDPFDAVNGKGIAQLKAAGVEVITGILEKEAAAVNKRFFTFHRQQRPYIILKWAQSSDAKMGTPDATRTFISNEYTNRLVHRWRSEEAAILVGGGTAIADNPSLTTRLWPGKNPVRLVLSRNHSLPANLHLLDAETPTVVFNYEKEEAKENLLYHKLNYRTPVVRQIAAALHSMQLQSLVVEGGPALLNLFIKEGLWDEARVITNTALYIGNGLPAPDLKQPVATSTMNIQEDNIVVYRHQQNPYA